MPPLTPGAGQDLAARWKWARERRDVDAMMELCAAEPDWRFDPYAPPLLGANAIRAHWNEVAARQTAVEFDAERVWVSGPTVLCSWHGAYTRQSDAQRVRERGFMTLELDDDGRIARLRRWTIERPIGLDSTVRPATAGPMAGTET